MHWQKPGHGIWIFPGHFGGHGVDGSDQPGATHWCGGAVAETAFAGRGPRCLEIHGDPLKLMGTQRNPGLKPIEIDRNPHTGENFGIFWGKFGES